MTTPARSAVVLIAGMTHRRARAAVAAVWPYVVLRLYNGTPAFYKEGLPYADDAYTSDDDVLRCINGGSNSETPTDRVLLLGASSSREFRNRIYTAFGLEPVLEFTHDHLNWASVFPWGRNHFPWNATLDEMQIHAERARDAFKVRYGRPPEIHDRFDDVKLPMIEPRA